MRDRMPVKGHSEQQSTSSVSFLAAVSIIVLFVAAVPAFSDPSTDGLSLLKSTQSAFREIAKEVLPTVVEVDVVNTVSAPQTTPFFGNNSPFNFFFGNPNRNQNQSPNNDPQSSQTQPQLKQQGLGSGIMVRQDGDKVYVLTNNHVAGNANQITIRLRDGHSFTGKLVGADPQRDLALVSFQSPSKMNLAKLGSSSDLQVGDWVLAVGNPLGFSSSVTFGIVSALGRRADVSGSGEGSFTDYIQTDAAINEGNSGGPLVNLDGQVVGINTWIASQTGGSIGLGFAIPIDNAKKAISDFITKGHVDYGWLGVNVGNVPPASQAGNPNLNGAFVYDIFRGSAADKAGVEPGDIITTVDGTDIQTSDDLVNQIGKLDPGRTIHLRVVRDDNNMLIPVTLGVRAENVDQQSANLWPGMSVVPLTDQIRQRLNLKSGDGDVVIGTVEQGSPAATAGLRPGDIVREVNNDRVRTVSEFYKDLAKARDNSDVMFRIFRQNTELVIGLSK